MDFHIAYTIDWETTSWACRIVCAVLLFVPAISCFMIGGFGHESCPNTKAKEYWTKNKLSIALIVFGFLSILNFFFFALWNDIDKISLELKEVDFAFHIPVWVMWSGGIMVGLSVWLLIGSIVAILMFRLKYAIEYHDSDINLNCVVFMIIWPMLVVYILLQVLFYCLFSPFIWFIKKFIKGV